MNEMMILQAENTALKEALQKALGRVDAVEKRIADGFHTPSIISEGDLRKLYSDLAASRAEAARMAEALKNARHTHWWIKTNVADGCKCQTCDGCKIEIHEAVYMAKTRLPEIDAALDSSTALSWLQENFIPRTEVEATRREWQPIETAPWDGTTIDTYTDWAPLRETDVHWDEEHKCWVRWEFDGQAQVWSECFPTHWMPLPSPPASKEAE